MKNKIVLGLCGLLVLGFLFVGCDTGNGTSDPAFVAVTNIDCPQTIAIVGKPLTLSGIVEPSNATNKTIVWSGDGCVDGVLTATSEKTYTVTATIANGTSESSQYTQDFEITAYDTTSDNQTNPFAGKQWKMSGTNFGYAWTGTGTFTDTTFESEVDELLNSTQGGIAVRGTYTWNGIGAEWTITESFVDGFVEVGDNGIFILLLDDNKMISANCNDPNMQGTFDLIQQ